LKDLSARLNKQMIRIANKKDLPGIMVLMKSDGAGYFQINFRSLKGE